MLGRRGGTKIIPVREVSGFSDGQPLDVPGKPRVVHAPGHTDGSAAILLKDRGGLVHRRRAVHLERLHRAHRAADHAVRPERRHARALASLASLNGITAGLLLPGHGDPWTGGVPDPIRRARAAGPS